MKKILLLFVFCVTASNLRAQDILIPYRKGKLWGLCDTNANIIVKPQFQKVEYNRSTKSFPFGTFTIKKNGKYGLMIKDKVIISPTFSSVMTYMEFIRTWERDSEGNQKQSLLSQDGKLQVKNIQANIGYIKIYPNGVVSNKYFELYTYAIKKRDKNYRSLIQTDGNGQIIKILLHDKKSIDRLESLKNMIRVQNHDGSKELFQVKKEGKKIILRNLTANKIDQSVPQFAVDGQDYSIDEEEEMDAPPPISIKESVRNGSKKNKRWQEFRSFNIRDNKVYLKGVRGNSTGKRKELMILKKCKNCVIIEYKHVGRYGTKYFTDSTEVHEKNFVLTKRKNKRGVITSRLYLPTKYNWVVAYGNRYKHPALFVLGSVSKNGGNKKAGVINDLGEWVVPLTAKYDSLIFAEYDNRFITEKNKKYGLLLDSGEELLLPIFDRIKKTKYGSYAMKSDGKWGLLHMKTLLIKPVFDDVPKYKCHF